MSPLSDCHCDGDSTTAPSSYAAPIAIELDGQFLASSNTSVRTTRRDATAKGDSRRTRAAVRDPGFVTGGGRSRRAESFRNRPTSVTFSAKKWPHDRSLGEAAVDHDPHALARRVQHANGPSARATSEATSRTATAASTRPAVSRTATTRSADRWCPNERASRRPPASPRRDRNRTRCPSVRVSDRDAVFSLPGRPHPSSARSVSWAGHRSGGALNHQPRPRRSHGLPHTSASTRSPTSRHRRPSVCKKWEKSR